MKQYTVNGQNYLAADLSTGEGGIMSLEKAMPVGVSVTKTDVANYMKAANLDELKDISFGGAGVAFSEVSLNKDIEMAINIAGLVMAEAQETALDKLVNREFDQALGKM
jgi:hypothetical protein